jgi:hypothetical protein
MPELEPNKQKAPQRKMCFQLALTRHRKMAIPEPRLMGQIPYHLLLAQMLTKQLRYYGTVLFSLLFPF